MRRTTPSSKPTSSSWGPTMANETTRCIGWLIVSYVSGSIASGAFREAWGASCRGAV